MTKAKIVTFDSRSELRAWFDLRGDEDRAIIYSNRESLPNNMVKYETIVMTRHGTQHLPEKSVNVVQRFLQRYTGTLGITTKMAEGAGLRQDDRTGTILPPRGPSFATKIVNHLKEFGRATDAASINAAINGGGLGSVYTKLVQEKKIIRLYRGYYIHPDYYKKDDSISKVAIPQAVEPQVSRVVEPQVSRVVAPTANGVTVGDRLVITEDNNNQQKDIQKVVELLGPIAVRIGSPLLFQKIMEIKAILEGATVSPQTPIIQPAQLVNTKVEVTLTKRQQKFGDYLKDKINQDITPQELVENVLGIKYDPTVRTRYIYDSDMSPHGWYRTRHNNVNYWRHESRRLSRRNMGSFTE